MKSQFKFEYFRVKSLQMESPYGALILAGGNSERMQFPKPFLLYKGKTFLRTLVDAYRKAGIEEIFVVLNEKWMSPQWAGYIEEVKPAAKVIVNKHPDRGRFYSVKLGSSFLQHKAHCFIQNIDNPCVNGEIINAMMLNPNPGGYTSPVFHEQNGHPILVDQAVMKYAAGLAPVNFNLRNVLARFPRKKLELNFEEVLVNINTAQEYEKHILKNS